MAWSYWPNNSLSTPWWVWLLGEPPTAFLVRLFAKGTQPKMSCLDEQILFRQPIVFTDVRCREKREGAENDHSRHGLRSDTAAGKGGGRLSRDERAPRDQGAAAGVRCIQDGGMHKTRTAKSRQNGRPAYRALSRRRRDLRHAHLDLVGRGWRRSVRPRVQRNRIQLVSGRAAAKGGSRHSRRDDKGISFRAEKRLHQ